VLSETGIIIRVSACGICGSDLHLYKEAGWVAPGTIMGHEFSGEIVEAGDRVPDLKAGDRVAAFSIHPCQQCEACKAGMVDQWCLQPLLGGINAPGAYAEYISVPYAFPGINVFTLAEDVTYEEGALLDPVGVGFMTVVKADPQTADAVAVFGAGTIGLSAVLALKTRGISKIIVSETSRLRLNMAGELGADILINAAEDDVAARIAEATGGMGPAIAIECSGGGKAFLTAVQTLQPRGRMVQAGIFTKPFMFDPNLIATRRLSLYGIMDADYVAAAAAINRRLADFKKLVTHTFPLEKIGEAFAMQARADESIKVVVKP
jgi:threonine dehydrogenase-like Zn-dependent dehydrogenase